MAKKVFQFYWIPYIDVNVRPRPPGSIPTHTRFAENEKGHESATRGPFYRRSGHGLNSCPWRPALDYVADAPGRPGSSRPRIDSIRDVSVIAREV